MNIEERIVNGVQLTARWGGYSSVFTDGSELILVQNGDNANRTTLVHVDEAEIEFGESDSVSNMGYLRADLFMAISNPVGGDNLGIGTAVYCDIELGGGGSLLCDSALLDSAGRATTDGFVIGTGIKINFRGPVKSDQRLVVWPSTGSIGDDNSGLSIQGRFLGSNGPAGDQFQVNDVTKLDQLGPRAAIGANGDFVVVWSSFSTPGSDNDFTSIQARQFLADGTPKGLQIQVNQTTPGFQEAPDAAIAQDGSFTVVWQDFNRSANQGGIYPRQFDAEGNALTDNMLMHVPGPGNRVSPRVSIVGEDLTVVWGVGGEVMMRATVRPFLSDGFEGVVAP